MEANPDSLRHKKRLIPWSEREDTLLCELYPIYGRKSSQFIPNRSPAACAIRASHLGISKENEWTGEEDARLREFYPTLGVDSATKIPGKSKHACKERAVELKLTKTNAPWTEAEDALLRKEFPEKGISVLPLFPSRSKQSIYCRASNLGIKSAGKKRWTENELYILRSFYHLRRVPRP